MLQITPENFEKEVVQSKVPVILDFYADWCGPCKMLGPVFEKLSSEFEGKIKFAKVDVQAHQNLAVQFGVQGIPNMTVLNDKKVITQIVGYQSENYLRDKLNQVLEQIQ